MNKFGENTYKFDSKRAPASSVGIVPTKPLLDKVLSKESEMHLVAKKEKKKGKKGRGKPTSR